MARLRAAERAPSRSLSSLGTCPSASRGLLSMGSRASRRPQRAGSGRAQLRDQGLLPKRLRAASAPQTLRRASRSPRPQHSVPTPLHPPCSRSSSAQAEPGPPALAPWLPISLPYCFLTGTASPLLTPRLLRWVGMASASLDLGPLGAKLQKNALGQQGPKYWCLGQEIGLGR